MKQLIKAAIVYNAELPTADLLNGHLLERNFSEILQLQTRSVGFVPIADGERHVAEFPGGLAFRIRIDEKIIPASVVQRELAKAIENIRIIEGRKVGKHERIELKEGIFVNLAAHAFARTSIITCFYEIATMYLIVPTTSKRLSDIVLTQLVQAVGSVKTTTINVSGIRHGLTTRLRNWLGHESGEFSTGEGFWPFDPCGEVALSQDKRRVTIKMGELQAAGRGLNEALTSGFGVTSLGFSHKGETEFRLTDDFHLKGIVFAHPPTEEDDVFGAEAALEVAAVSRIVTELCALLAYEDETAAE